MKAKELVNKVGLEPLNGGWGKAITGKELTPILDFITQLDEFKGKKIEIIEKIEVKTPVAIEYKDIKVSTNEINVSFETIPELITVKEDSNLEFNDTVKLYSMFFSHPIDGKAFFAYRVTPDSVKTNKKIKVKELIELLSSYNQEAELSVIVDSKKYPFTLSFGGGAEGETKDKTNCVNFYVDELCCSDNSRETNNIAFNCPDCLADLEWNNNTNEVKFIKHN